MSFAFFPAANIYPGISSFLRTLPWSQRLMNGIHHVFIKLQLCLLLESEPLTNPSTRIRRRVFIICNRVQFTLSAPTFNLAWETTDNQVHHCLKIMIQHAHESDLKQYLAFIVRAPLMNLFFFTVVLCIYLIMLLALKFPLHVVITISMQYFCIKRDHEEFILLKYFLIYRVNIMHQAISEIVGTFNVWLPLHDVPNCLFSFL